jgi:predicted nucleic acid-binding protein
VAALIDTNVLVYRFDSRYPQKQHTAEGVLRRCVAEGSGRVAHQAILEFFSVVTRPTKRRPPLLTIEEATREVELLLSEFDVLYPNRFVVQTALRGVATHQLSWYDAHHWAYAETYGISELISEDFQHDRVYGNVRAVNPFLDSSSPERH